MTALLHQQPTRLLQRALILTGQYRQRLDRQGEVESMLPPPIPQQTQLTGPRRHRLRRLPDQHRWDLLRDQDFPGCPQMTSLGRSLKTHTRKGIDLTPGRQIGKGP